jgi:dihydrofolate synthase/folylpolyglutamate synthase
MNYEEAVEFIESLSPTQVRPGLERFDLFMKEGGSLQDNIPCVHIAGTNGKGSVSTIIAETLYLAGVKTGKYTGPHLFAFNERYDINHKKINNADFARLCTDIKNKSDAFAQRHPEHGTLTWFEIITAIAFYYFAEQGLDATVLEVGLGGRFDATSVVSAPIATAIVTVGLDHQHILGNTIEEIAAEKAGIIKDGVPLVTACTGTALDTILHEAKSKSVPVIRVDAEGQVSAANDNAADCAKAIEERFALDSGAITSAIQAEKSYQRLNASVAAAVLALWEIQTKQNCLVHFKKALSSYFWPGRLQYFEKQKLLLDGAHNADGARALRKTIERLFPEQSRCFILSFYKSKQFEEIMSILLRPEDRVFASQTAGRRAVVSKDEIARKAAEMGCRTEVFEDLNSAFLAAAKEGVQYLKIGCGSFATVSAGLKYLAYKSVEDSQLDSRNL